VKRELTVDVDAITLTLRQTIDIVGSTVKTLQEQLRALQASAQGPTLQPGDPIAHMPGFVYAGPIRGENGEDWHIAALIDNAAAGIRELRGVWGEYGASIGAANHRRDGLANTQAMANAGSAIAKAALDADAYVASQAEAQLVSANLHDLMPSGWHWTSTQYSPHNAWVQNFGDGRSRLQPQGQRAPCCGRPQIQFFGLRYFDGERMSRALVEIIAGTAFIAIVLGWLGPKLDEPTRTYASYGYTPEQQADHHSIEQDARDACARTNGDNGGVIFRADGAVVCTDKHGRVRRNRITIAVKTEVPQ
jgi:hypothetical protein